MNTQSPAKQTMSEPRFDWIHKGMRVRPYDSALRFVVTSQTEGDDKCYIVQLDSYWCTGRCSCEDFTFRHEPVLVRERHNDEESLRCKHIKAARMCFASHMVRLLSEQEAKK
jgi:hypothetical protein